MNLRLMLASLLYLASPLALAQATFVFASLPDPIAPLERASKYEDPLNAALAKAKLGEVTGGGTAQDRSGKILSIGLDIELTDLKTGLPFLKQTLLQLGAPKGGTLEYQHAGKTVVVPLVP